MTDEEALDRLMQIKHIVVLMMENRSFDQMLGYLTRDGMPDVRGLTGDESNPAPDGTPIPVFEWGPGETVFHPIDDPTGKILDPCHSEACVKEQLAGNNQGFVRNFVNTRVEIPLEYHRLPMGYYGAKHLPTYDFLARNYCVCDAWHSSIPGDTWPNRLYALAGMKGEKALPSILDKLDAAFHHRLSAIEKLEQAPIYDVHAFTRELADEQWRWYSHDPATLRAADRTYREFADPRRDNFAFYDRQRMSLLTRLLEHETVGPDSFLDDAANGQLRPVSWIDPNFIDLKVLDPNSNDDHPPSDVKAGQALALGIYEALRNSRDWQDTLFLILYDEHGGFHDHIAPPNTTFDDGSGHSTYGLRVPAIAVGPRVASGVSHQFFEHTSIIKTILLRFANDPENAINAVGPRVKDAAHLGLLLLPEPRTDNPDPSNARTSIDAWHTTSRAERRGLPSRGSPTGPSLAPDGAGHRLAMHEFQEDFARFAIAMHWAGLPMGEP